MSTTAQVLFVVVTAMVFLVRLAVALYGAQADKRSAESYQRRHIAEHVLRGRAVE